jgi:hypothetical protein
MSTFEKFDIVAATITGAAFAPQSVTSGTPINGETIDKEGTNVNATHAAVVLVGTATLSSGATLTLTVARETADSSGFAGSTVTTAGTVTISSSGAFAAAVRVDVTTAKRYLRARVTPTLSAPGTDSATVGAAYMLAGLSVV